MKNVPFYLKDTFMSLYRVVLVFAFLLGFSSILAGVGYTLFVYVNSELSLLGSMYHGFVLFLKGAGLSALFGLIGFLAFWKRHHIMYMNCKETGNDTCCKEIGFFNLA